MCVELHKFHSTVILHAHITVHTTDHCSAKVCMGLIVNASSNGRASHSACKQLYHSWSECMFSTLLVDGGTQNEWPELPSSQTTNNCWFLCMTLKAYYCQCNQELWLRATLHFSLMKHQDGKSMSLIHGVM